MANEAQKEYWNGEVGSRWAERDDFMTRLLEPAAFALLEKISPESGIDAIDIGCGGGSQTITLAEKIGAGHRFALKCRPRKFTKTSKFPEIAGIIGVFGVLY